MIKKQTAIALSMIALTFLGAANWQLRSHASTPFIDTIATCNSNMAAASTPTIWSVSTSETNGLPILTKDGREAMTASYAFWGSNWTWAKLSTNFNIAAPCQYTITGNNKTLNFALNGRISTSSSHQLVWQIELDTHNTRTDAKGGMVFKFDLNAFGNEMDEPQLLPDNEGWAWGKEGGSRVEMRFEPPVPALFFERGKKSELRAFFFDGPIATGKQRYTLTLSMSRNMTIRPTQSERFGIQDTSRWPRSNLDWQTSPVDLSFLNESEKPAGRRGFVKAVGESLVFEDGTPARFWGANITAYALFNTSKGNVKRQAKRISALGFNLVRIHHHDSPWVKPNIFGKDAADTRKLDSASLDKLDWWIKCLKDEGIYVWLDLHVQRSFTEGDRIRGNEEIRKGGKAAGLKGYSYVNPDIQQAMRRFNESYLNHTNVYTDVAYKNEPAIIALLVTNENDITHHFGNLLLPNKNVPLHNKLYMNLATEFSTRTGLPKNKTWRSWEPGPSKLFLNDLEHRFNLDMIAHLRALGAKVPIATTSTWGNNPLYSLPALTAGDIIDVHAYGGALELEKNPLITANMVNWLSAGQVVGKPMSVTEWNVSPFPTPDRHSSPLFIASAARLQGWDAVMLYAYGQSPLNNAGVASNWNAFNDPSLVATLPAAALLYRQGHVREAVTTYALSPDKEQMFYQSISPDNSIAARTASEKGKLVVVMPEIQELLWLKKGVIPPGAKVIRNLNQSMIEGNATEVLSDTGEIRRNWRKGVYTINTPRAQAAMGWIGNERIVLPEVTFDVRSRNATVIVQSLDGMPIKRSSALLVSLAARSVPSAGNRQPFRSEPVLGQLTIQAPSGLKLLKITAQQQEVEIPVNYIDGRYVINLKESLGTSWLFLK
jgi:hypothetical protein